MSPIPETELENLKKRAKQVLRWWKERHWPVAAQIRAALPRFQGLTDAEVFAQPFRLADAQELVARQEGFDGWNALKTGLAPRAERPASYPARPVLLGVEPQLYVTDLARSLGFYTEVLGFQVAFSYGEPAFYAQVVRDGARLNLRHLDAPLISPSLHAAEPDLLAALIHVSDAKLLFRELQARGAPFHQTLKRAPWEGPGHGGFIVRDPDGNLISFGGRTG